MGNPKQKWTSEEEDALRAGVKKHGTGKWKNIQKDPEFNQLLHSRSNIDLKDKWRNMSISAGGQGSREKSRTPKAKSNTDAPTAIIPFVPTSASITPVTIDTMDVMEDSSKCLLDGKVPVKCNAWISEALSTLRDPDGSDTSAIASFIEQRHEVPHNFRRLLSSRLRRLVAQDKLEKKHDIHVFRDNKIGDLGGCPLQKETSKVQNCYKIKQEILVGGAKTQNSGPKQPSYMTGSLGDTIQEAAKDAALKIADAENKAFVAAEAVKEAERVAKMFDNVQSFLKLTEEIWEKCSRGEIVLME